MHTSIRSGLVVCAAMLAAVAPCAAQGSVEFASFAGMYLPSSHSIGVDNGCPGSGPVVRQHATPVFGARVTAWVGERLAVDLALDHSTGGATSFYGATLGDNGKILTGSARLLVGLTPRTARTSFSVTAGVARVAHRGAAYAIYPLAATSWGPTVGAVGRYRLTTALALRAELEDYTYWLSGTRSNAYPFSPTPFQSDLLMSFGLSVTPFGHSEVAP